MIRIGQVYKNLLTSSLWTVRSKVGRFWMLWNDDIGDRGATTSALTEGVWWTLVEEAVL